MNESFEELFLSGRKLYGDDFTPEQIREWFEREREGYANLGNGELGDSGAAYSYHALNQWHTFRHLPTNSRYSSALGVGSAQGLEFEPIADRIASLTILEPSDQLVSSQVAGLIPRYVKPHADGTMPFDDGEFDLILCFGTLHHIPNVSHVVREMGRVLAPGGRLLVREPIVSMGDWRVHREGVTASERGIPVRLLVGAVTGAGLDIQRKGYSGFPPVVRGSIAAGLSPYLSKSVTILDAILSRMSRPFYRYHAVTQWQKLRPTSLSLVATKPR